MISSAANNDAREVKSSSQGHNNNDDKTITRLTTTTSEVGAKEHEEDPTVEATEEEELNKEKFQLLKRKDWMWDWRDEPHLRRRVAMLRKYPEIKKLFGPDHTAKFKLLAIVLTHLLSCYLVKDSSWTIFLITSYIIGATMAHSCTTVIHEACHGLLFDCHVYNLWAGIVVNLPMGVPVAISFNRYHTDHHQFQGVIGHDPDLGTKLEAQYINTPIRKLLNVIFYSAFYALRPMLVRPKTPSKWEIINSVTQLSFNALIIYLWGWNAMLYMLVSTFLGLGLHPCAGHFIQEHFVTSENGQETYSYYGPFNYILMNVGYHNEHHDFPRIAGNRLHLLKNIAPDFYEHLEVKTSYLYSIYEYIFTDGFGHYNRRMRTREVHEKSRKAIFRKVNQSPQQQSHSATKCPLEQETPESLMAQHS